MYILEGSQSPSPLSSPSNAWHSTSPQQLTPRSKVKALLAAIDDESDSENILKTAGSGSKVLVSPMARKEHRNGNLSQRGIESEDEAEDEGSDVAPVKPRGRLAARLQGHDMVKEGSGVDEEHANAYERIRIQLLSGPATESRKISPVLSNSGSEDNVEPLKSAPRRIKPVAVDSNHSQPPPPRRRITSQRSPPGSFLSLKPVSSPKQSVELAGNDGNDGLDSDLPPDPQISSKVLQLVARKKAEREAKEAKEARKWPKPQQKFHGKKLLTRSHPASTEVSEDDIDDKEGERRLTQQTRPIRKASRKALDEMNRETQRMSRNMQLAHQAKTKKKISKESLFARFNYRTSNPSNESTLKLSSSSTAPSSAPASEFEGVQDVESPPSSPPKSTGDTASQKLVMELPELNQVSVMNALNFGAQASTSETTAAFMGGWEQELPNMFEIVNPPKNQLDEGKEKAVVSSPEQNHESSLEQNLEKPKEIILARPQTQVQPQQLPMTVNHVRDSDSDLEIVPNKTSKSSKPDVFERLAVRIPSEERSLQTLRALAHLTSPSKRNSKPKAFMSLLDMETLLQRRARQQAASERAEKIQGLKDRGILVQTAEERERDQVEVEDLVEKARREAEEIMQKEKSAARKEKKGNGEDYALSDTSDDDKDYQDNEADESNIELSGSEEEELVDEEEERSSDNGVDTAEGGGEQEGGISVANDRPGPEGFFNTAASGGSDNEEVDIPVDDEDENDEPNTRPLQRKPRINRVIDEDEDEDEDKVNTDPNLSETFPAVQCPLIPGSSVSDETSVGIMGMTQAFAATMAESQTQTANENPDEDQAQDSLTFLGPMPEPNFPVFDLNDSQPMVLDSQKGEQQEQAAGSPADIELHFSQSQAQDVAMEDNRGLPPTATQYSEIPDPTQDVGFALSSPGPEQRFTSIPPSTVDTVVLSRATEHETPKVIRKGRLRRRMIATAEDSNGENLDGANRKEDAEFQISANAFDVLKDSGGKEARIANYFDKKKSEAIGMVEEQAQESEDEYAGLGGASDDESGGEEDEEVRKMIEEGEVKVDEGELAAFYA